MSYGNREKPSDDEYNAPLHRGKELPPLEPLPEREWLKGQISNVEYRYVYFKGKQQFVVDKDSGEPILDANEQPIPRKEFNVTVSLRDFQLPNGEPRKAWIKLGASLHPKANLPKFLRKMEMNIDEDPSPQHIKEYLEGLNVKLQMANITGSNGQEYQQVVWDAVKPDLGA